MNNYNSFANLLKGEEMTKDYPSIIVSPDGNSGYWSDWYNAGTFGPPEYETYVIDQLIPLIDARYRTDPDRSQRAVSGISMGGYGSLMLASRHPDLFGQAASMSGALDSNDEALAAALTVSSTFDGGGLDAIYGSRLTEEVRWRGHNPTDLAANLRNTNLQVRTANGILNPAIGEGDKPEDALSCFVELGVYQGTINMHEELTRLGVDHLWKDYGDGCHTPENFTRQTVDTLAAFEEGFASPAPAPTSFEYSSIEPNFEIYDWRVDADPKRALEFMKVAADRRSITLTGSGRTAVTTPPWFRGLKAVDAGGEPVRPGADGRISFNVDLGPAHETQQYRLGAATTFKKATVELRPHALVKITQAKRVKRGVKVCFRSVGGTLPNAQIKAGKRKVKVKVTAKAKCRTLKLRGKPRSVTIAGRDTFGHFAKARANVKPKR
jgi:S-formylglutathione hydrolase FrmB